MERLPYPDRVRAGENIPVVDELAVMAPVQAAAIAAEIVLELGDEAEDFVDLLHERFVDLRLAEGGA